MPVPLRLLLVEDSETDAALALYYLERHGFAVTSHRVTTAREFTAALGAGEWDAVLADYALPSFSAPEALGLLQAAGRDLPFLILSGVIDEESAVTSLRAGAHDFITKANHARLGPALERELRAAQDRQARRAAEAAQQRQTLGFQLLFQDNPLPMWVYDPDSLRFLEVNQAAIAHYGYSRDEWLALTVRDIRPPEDLPRLMDNIRHARGRPDRSGPWTHVKKNGERIEVEVAANDTLFAGRPARLVLALDVTEQRRAEAARAESEARFRQVWESATDGLVLTDAEGTVLAANPAYCDLYGIEPAALLGQPFTVLVPAAERDANLAHYRELFHRPEPALAFESALRRVDGGRREVEARVAFITAHGQRTAMLTTLRDITDRKQAEAALVESEARFRQVWERTTDALALSDAEGTVLAANPAYLDLYGYTAEQVVGHNFAIIFPEEARAQARAGYHHTFTTPGDPPSYETTVRRADGTERIVEASASFLTSGGQRTAMLSTIHDVTQRRQAEAQIQRQFAYLTALRDIDRAISGSLDPRLSLSLLLTHATDDLGVDAATVWTFRPETQTLERLVERGLRPRPPSLSTQRLGDGPVGRAALERRPVHLPDLNTLSAASRLAQAALAEGFASLHALPLIAKGEVRGVLEVYQRAPHAAAPEAEWLDFLHALAGQAAIALDNALLFTGLQRANVDLTAAFDSLLEALAQALDRRGGEPPGHSRRVADLAETLGRALGLGGVELNHLRRGALLHDLGKLGVPERLLLQAEPLTAADWQVLRAAPGLARDLLVSVSLLRPVAAVPFAQHEHWDGSGYPAGLAAEQIPLPARLCAVASAWEALRADRPYRRALSAAQARDHLQAQAGKQFDPKVVRAFMELNSA